MPGKTEYTFAGLVHGREGKVPVYNIELVSPSVNKRTVFFTDESPEFRIKVENLADKKIKGPLTFFLGYGTGTFEHIDRETFEVEIEPDSHEYVTLDGNLLTYQGNGVICHEPPTNFNSDPNDGDYFDIYSNKSGEYEPLFTFTIWDRHFYRMNYQWPRRAQFASAILAVLIVLVGIIQILLNLNCL